MGAELQGLKLLQWGMCFLVLVNACGCNRTPRKYQVVGKITLDGKPLSQGEIVFSTTDNKASEAGKIHEGEYRLAVLPLPHRVAVNASILVPNPAANEFRGDKWYYKNIVPFRYNQETILTATIVARDDNRCDFALTSIAP